VIKYKCELGITLINTKVGKLSGNQFYAKVEMKVD
jgi:hypothetical protein